MRKLSSFTPAQLDAASRRVICVHIDLSSLTPNQYSDIFNFCRIRGVQIVKSEVFSSPFASYIRGYAPDVVTVINRACFHVYSK